MPRSLLFITLYLLLDWIVVYLLPYLIPLTQMSFSASCYSTVTLTLERYFSVCKPFFKQRYNVKAYHFLVPMFIFVVIYSTPRFFEMEVSSFTEVNCTDVELARYHYNDTNDMGNVTFFEEYDIKEEDGVFWVLVFDTLVQVNRSCQEESFPEISFKPLRKNPLYVKVNKNIVYFIDNLRLSLSNTDFPKGL